MTFDKQKHYLTVTEPFFAFKTFKEFKEERRILLEVIGPELQALYDDRQIEVS